MFYIKTWSPLLLSPGFYFHQSRWGIFYLHFSLSQLFFYSKTRVLLLLNSNLIMSILYFKITEQLLILLRIKSKYPNSSSKPFMVWLMLTTYCLVSTDSFSIPITLSFACCLYKNHSVFLLVFQINYVHFSFWTHTHTTFPLKSET